MTTVLFDYPKKAAFGRVLPKSKIYEHARPTSAIKELFVRQVEQISWQYKLAPETINIKGTMAVPEIQVFSIALRDGELKTEVLRCIDQAIPFPLPLSGPVKPMLPNGSSVNISMVIGHSEIRYACRCRWFSTSKRSMATY